MVKFNLSDAALEVAIARGHDVAARLRDPLQNAVVGIRPLYRRGVFLMSEVPL